jgi:integral membrane protein (TIGR01906 family)
VKRTEVRATHVVTIILRTYITLILPWLLVLAGVRLVMSPAFLYFEYSRPGFPEDFYGFTAEDRLHYGPYALDYLLNSEDIAFLGRLRSPEGGSLFNVRELQHMRDVKVVTQLVYLAGILSGLAATIVTARLYSSPATRRDLRLGLLNGSILTLGLVAAIVIAAIVNWDFFFTTFHSLLFQSGTWRFAYSDTLIRLFPEQFWFDAALLIGSMTIMVALIILFGMWRWRPKVLK